MINRLRDFFRNELIGITIPVGVVAGLALSELLRTAFLYMLTPLLSQTPLGDEEEGFSNFGFTDLDFNIGDASISYGIPLVDLLTLAFAALIAWWLFVRPTAAELAAAGDDDGMRECLECKSSIVADATRCAFCTARVVPVSAES
ncbi:MAG: hypothetical protein WEB52_08935 [Dehalococcoidia bacterium]